MVKLHVAAEYPSPNPLLTNTENLWKPSVVFKTQKVFSLDYCKKNMVASVDANVKYLNIKGPYESKVNNNLYNLDETH